MYVPKVTLRSLLCDSGYVPKISEYSEMWETAKCQGDILRRAVWPSFVQGSEGQDRIWGVGFRGLGLGVLGLGFIMPLK